MGVTIMDNGEYFGNVILIWDALPSESLPSCKTCFQKIQTMKRIPQASKISNYNNVTYSHCN